MIITGGGIGYRMGSPIPKQFLDLAGKPLIVHTIRIFQEYDKDIQIVVVLPELYLKLWDDIQNKYFSKNEILRTRGGATRFESVKNGLSLLGEDLIIGVHDAVRPMVSSQVIARCYELAQKEGSAIPVLPLSESVRKVEGKGNHTVSREGLRIIQTPQVFHGSLLKRAYTTEYDPEFTDDAIVVERLGVKIFLTNGNPENIKITTPFDMIVATCYFNNK